MSVTLERLSAYHDEELDAEDQRLTAAHVAGCGSCRSTLDAWRGTADALLTRPADAPPRSRRLTGLTLAAIATLLVIGSGAALATGWLSEVFRIGPLSAASSRPVTLEEARVAQLPLPRSSQLLGGWNIKQIQMTITPEWRSVDVQYSRSGSRPMGVTVWSSGINVNPGGVPSEVVTVSGVPVELRYGESATARFVQDGATVIIRAFQPEVDATALKDLVAAWIAQAN
jgi:hypothetical protein